MSIKQISVFLENKSGTLSRMTSTLAAHSVNIRALCVAETKDFGIVRIIVDDAIAASTVLKDADFIASLTPVIAFEIPAETGGLGRLLESFNKAQVNIEYMYSFLGGKKASSAYMIFRVADAAAAEAALVKQGLKPLRQEDISDI